MHFNRVAEDTLQTLRRRIDLPGANWGVVVQLFAGDISAAISHRRRETVLALAGALAESTLETVGGLDLEVSIPKCRNFLVEREEGTGAKSGAKKDIRNTKTKDKEQKKIQMIKSLDEIK